MPDSLILESPAQPSISAARPVAQAAWQPDSDLFRLRRELASAEDALNVGLDDDKAARAYHTANDRFLEAPVHSMAGVLLKLERLAEIEDMVEQSARAPDQLVFNLIRDLRALSVGATTAVEPASAAASALDVVAIHRAADKEVDEIYRINARVVEGLQVLRLIGRSLCQGTDDWTKLRFVIDVLSGWNNELTDTNDRLTNAIDPLNPTVLDE